MQVFTTNATSLKFETHIYFLYHIQKWNYCLNVRSEKNNKYNNCLPNYLWFYWFVFDVAYFQRHKNSYFKKFSLINLKYCSLGISII